MTSNKIIRLNAYPEGFQNEVDELEQEMFESAIPVQHTHSYYEDESKGLYIGVWDTTDMIEAAGPYECDEFMWLLEGTAQIKNNKSGNEEYVQAGESFVIPWGYDCQWHQTGYLRKFYVIYDHPNETLPDKPTYEGIIKPESHSKYDRVTANQPFGFEIKSSTQESNICYQDESKNFTVGIWESESFNSDTQTFPNSQFIYVLEGTLEITSDNQKVDIFKTGDALFIAESTTCRWQSLEQLRLLFTVIK